MADRAATVPCEGVSALTGRTEPWMEELLGDPEQVAALVSEHGSPVNVLDFEPLARNAGELVDAASAEGVRLSVFVARKANKAMGLVRAARAAGLGIDVASHAELSQCLEDGADGEELIVTAAVKSQALIETAVDAGAVLSLDNADELDDVRRIGLLRGVEPRVALRLAVSDPAIAPTRFGLTAQTWDGLLPERRDGVRVEGIHFHLNGYSAAERAIALREALEWSDRLRDAGHPVAFVDMGGGIPMSYLEQRSQWRAFWERLADDGAGSLTWRGDRLGLVDPGAARPSPAVYPYWQESVRGAWLREVLRAPAGDRSSVAAQIAARGLELRCEPGRSVLDGCGITLASVAFRKATSDGVPLVGLHMNRTQVRSTSADFMVDPRWVRPAEAGIPSDAFDGFLVGAYCVEDELILRRKLRFSEGVARGDIAAFINTGGYLMHILESASHQLPLAATVVRDGVGWVRDDIDVLVGTPARA
ncbi:Y4yA family PLP-dependent enzyme [Demequina activiva]|uniref:Diaminopimelate decarboxylase n=1 Tax=Demequina activiva TaxID=1582364 RepID=A0A919UF75_9MICO|nr:Y4yA family PLP-dependent enzyme [Demequina activiva]GIG53367.1 diaminopimelate decarboxylase [Demequina activiva]